jgi:hypothetical protein
MTRMGADPPAVRPPRRIQQKESKTLSKSSPRIGWSTQNRLKAELQASPWRRFQTYFTVYERTYTPPAFASAARWALTSSFR